ncbi:MAG TPA: hypothetical protein VHA74_02450 [Candidatus Dojkabacteria bacterium]|nr:hypothetical protein [Candidatus Dojkabacteria bacterium]
MLNTQAKSLENVPFEKEESLKSTPQGVYDHVHQLQTHFKNDFPFTLLSSKDGDQVFLYTQDLKHYDQNAPLLTFDINKEKGEVSQMEIDFGVLKEGRNHKVKVDSQGKAIDGSNDDRIDSEVVMEFLSGKKSEEILSDSEKSYQELIRELSPISMPDALELSEETNELQTQEYIYDLAKKKASNYRASSNWDMYEKFNRIARHYDPARYSFDQIRLNIVGNRTKETVRDVTLSAVVLATLTACGINANSPDWEPTLKSLTEEEVVKRLNSEGLEVFANLVENASKLGKSWNIPAPRCFDAFGRNISSMISFAVASVKADSLSYIKEHQNPDSDYLKSLKGKIDETTNSLNIEIEDSKDNRETSLGIMKTIFKRLFEASDIHHAVMIQAKPKIKITLNSEDFYYSQNPFDESVSIPGYDPESVNLFQRIKVMIHETNHLLLGTSDFNPQELNDVIKAIGLNNLGIYMNSYIEAMESMTEGIMKDPDSFFRVGWSNRGWILNYYGKTNDEEIAKQYLNLYSKFSKSIEDYSEETKNFSKDNYDEKFIEWIIRKYIDLKDSEASHTEKEKKFLDAVLESDIVEAFVGYLNHLIVDNIPNRINIRDGYSYYPDINETGLEAVYTGWQKAIGVSEPDLTKRIKRIILGYVPECDLNERDVKISNILREIGDIKNSDIGFKIDKSGKTWNLFSTESDYYNKETLLTNIYGYVGKKLSDTSLLFDNKGDLYLFPTSRADRFESLLSVEAFDNERSTLRTIKIEDPKWEEINIDQIQMLEVNNAIMGEGKMFMMKIGEGYLGPINEYLKGIWEKGKSFKVLRDNKGNGAIVRATIDDGTAVYKSQFIDLNMTSTFVDFEDISESTVENEARFKSNNIEFVFDVRDVLWVQSGLDKKEPDFRFVFKKLNDEKIVMELEMMIDGRRGIVTIKDFNLRLGKG